MTSDIESMSDAVGGEGRKTFIARRISIAHCEVRNGDAARKVDHGSVLE
jgi:hypothetical protein